MEHMNAMERILRRSTKRYSTSMIRDNVALSWKIYEESLPCFLDSVFEYVTEKGLDVAGLRIDHVGLRVRLPAHVEELRKELQELCTNHMPLSVAQVNGRQIC